MGSMLTPLTDYVKRQLYEHIRFEAIRRLGGTADAMSCIVQFL
jgi:hypothetical protein